jgi:hypothetical protein
MLNSFKFMRAPSTHVHIFHKIYRMNNEANRYIQPGACYTLTSIYHFAGGDLYLAASFSPDSC